MLNWWPTHELCLVAINMVSQPKNTAGQLNTTAKIVRGLGELHPALWSNHQLNTESMHSQKNELNRGSSKRDNSPLTPPP